MPSGARLTLEIVSVSETTAARVCKDCRVIAMKDDNMDFLNISKDQERVKNLDRRAARLENLELQRTCTYTFSFRLRVCIILVRLSTKYAGCNGYWWERVGVFVLPDPQL